MTGVAERSVATAPHPNPAMVSKLTPVNAAVRRGMWIIAFLILTISP